MNIGNMKATDVKAYISNILKSEDKSIDYEALIRTLENDNRVTVKNLGKNVIKFLENRKKEIIRVRNMYEFDKKYIKSGTYLAGADEVGRGPLAGPIVAAAVVLDLDIINDENLILRINDSKKISFEVREELSKIIKERAVSYSIQEISSEEIDEKGIAWCNNEVLKRSVCNLKVDPDLVLSDGYKIKNCTINNEFVVKGDAKSASIACASIIAKVYRDNLMIEYSKKYPEYMFNKNMGYGTKEHIEAIKKFGCTKIHRKSFLTNILNTF
ncbi:ribonuclease HII [Clostridium novyi A str. 4570]|uniref:Ribonuclease HII n=1 Tax=Clostridium novyi A str. 4570 TaxID=1444290 RepID=A0AA88ZRX5_CLONO|nr:ribonuclease HII [Clostridium novyi]KGN02902.1 ribonuclease HII [Clostridium novyi A str. 4570]